MTTINFGNGTVIHGSVVNRGYNKVEENNVHINYDTLDNDLTKVRDILLTNHCNAEDIEYIDGILKAIKNKDNAVVSSKLKNFPNSILQIMKEISVQIGSSYLAKLLGL